MEKKHQNGKGKIRRHGNLDKEGGKKKLKKIEKEKRKRDEKDRRSVEWRNQRVRKSCVREGITQAAAKIGMLKRIVKVKEEKRRRQNTVIKRANV